MKTQNFILTNPLTKVPVNFIVVNPFDDMWDCYKDDAKIVYSISPVSITTYPVKREYIGSVCNESLFMRIKNGMKLNNGYSFELLNDMNGVCFVTILEHYENETNDSFVRYSENMHIAHKAYYTIRTIGNRIPDGFEYLMKYDAVPLGLYNKILDKKYMLKHKDWEIVTRENMILKYTTHLNSNVAITS